MANRDALKKFLEDNTQFTDATEVRIGNEVTTLGDLRSLNSEERTQLSTAMKTATERQGDLDKRQKEILDLSQKAQQAYAAAEDARAKASSQVRAEPGADPWADPWLAPVKKIIDERDAKIASLTEQLGTVVKIVGNAANIFSEDRYDREYSGINFGNREKKPTRKEILDFATEHKIVDRLGIPSVSGAWAKMSEGDRLEDLRKDAFEKGREAARQEQMAARMPAPGVPGPGMSGTTPKVDPTKGELGDLYAEANKDPELRALMEQMGSFSN
jgi:hypothetical protein